MHIEASTSTNTNIISLEDQLLDKEKGNSSDMLIYQYILYFTKK